MIVDDFFQWTLSIKAKTTILQYKVKTSLTKIRVISQIMFGFEKVSEESKKYFESILRKFAKY